jgi:pimeloyl-ACP methyl ester carboxylesterase
MIVENTFTINSTLDYSSNLLSKYCYDDANVDMPIVVMMHGFNLDIDAITSTIMQRIANEGYFVLAAGMRGRKGATGSEDASGKEIHDIYDAIQYVQTNFPTLVSDKVTISGYSGGGGNALAAVSKFPDTFNVCVDHFGMSDYGYDGTYGWYYTNPSYQSDIVSFIGNTPAIVPEKYLARAHVNAVKNFASGELYAFHDEGDGSVDVVQSQRLEAVLNGSIAGQFYYSDSEDVERYLHSMDTSAITEPTWLPRANAVPAWEVADSGTIRVCGYIITKKFKIYLGNLGDRTADVTYNLALNKFDVTPLSGSTTVRIERDGNMANAIISTPTSIYPTTPIGASGKIKTVYAKDTDIIKVKNVFEKQGGIWRKAKV